MIFGLDKIREWNLLSQFPSVFGSGYGSVRILETVLEQFSSELLVTPDAALFAPKTEKEMFQSIDL
jgi:hypothetical protein